MKDLKLGLVAIIVCLAAMVGHGVAVANPKYANMTRAQIDKELKRVLTQGKQLRILDQLKQIGRRISNPSHCGRHHQEARRTYDSLAALNRRYQGRADKTYARQAQQLRAQNRRAVDAYRQCFSQRVQSEKAVRSHGVKDYASYKKLFSKLATGLHGLTDKSLKQKADALYAARQNIGTVSKFPVATVANATGSHQIIRNNRQVRANYGVQIKGGDQIRVGRTGSVIIQFQEVVGKAKRGPFQLSVGPNSVLKINKFANMVVQVRDKDRIRMPLDLEYGTIRLNNAGAGFDSDYTVRAGSAVARVAGADTIISHYPKRKQLANVKVRSGSVTVNAGSQATRTVRTNQQVSVRRGITQKVAKLSGKQWNAAMNAAGATTPGVSNPVAQPGRQPANRQDILIRAAALEAVDRMLGALKSADASGLLDATSGQARESANRSLTRAGMNEMLRQSGRPQAWATDCVACQPDGTCEVPTVVQLLGGPRSAYEALHVVRPDASGRRYLVDRIDPWNANRRQQFNRKRPLCQAELK